MIMRNFLPSLFALLCLVTPLAAEPVAFSRQVAPILLEQCLACHGPKKAEGGYRVDTYERAMAGGDSGDGFTAGDHDGSEAFRRMVSDDKAERMPLEADPLPATTVAVLRQWIIEGAKFDGEDPKADLVSIVPPPEHPAAPEKYPATLPVTAMAFHPNGKEIFVGGYHEMTVWNTTDGALLRRIGNAGQRTYSLEVSPDGKLLAAASGAPGKIGEVRLYDLASGELVRAFGRTSDVVFAARFDPEGKRIAAVSADGKGRIYSVENGAELSAITSHSDWIQAVAWSPDGKRLATASRDKTAKVFEVESGDLLATYSKHEADVRGVAFHPDGEQVYSAAADNRVRRWKISDTEKAEEVVRCEGEVFFLQTVGKSLLVTAADKKVRRFEADTKKAIRTYEGLNDWALTVAMEPSNKQIAAGAFDGEVKIWNAETGEEITSFLAAPGR